MFVTTGLTLNTVTDVSAVLFSSPSVTSTRTIPVQSSPHVYVGVAFGDQGVSQVPSPLKSHRNCRGSSSESEEPLASNVTGVPSGTEPTGAITASGGLLRIVVSGAFPWTAHSVRDDAVTVAMSVMCERPPGTTSPSRIGRVRPGAIGPARGIFGSAGA